MRINKWSLDLDVFGNLEKVGINGVLGMKDIDLRKNEKWGCKDSEFRQLLRLAVEGGRDSGTGAGERLPWTNYLCPLTHPKFLRGDPNPQGEGIRRWGLWKLAKPWRKSPYEWDTCPYERSPRETQEKDGICELGSGLSPDTESAQQLALWLPSLQNGEKQITEFIPPSWWHFML